MLSRRFRADLALGICALIWGSTFVVIKDALAGVSVAVYLAVRFALAAFLMAAIYWKTVRRLTLPAILAGIQIGFFMFGGFVFQIWGLRSTTPSNAAFITGSYVVMVPVFLAASGRSRIAKWIWCGTIAVLAGLYFLTVPVEGISKLNRGDLLVLVCAAMFAVHMILIAKHVQHHSVAALSFLQVATAAVLSAVLVPVASAAGWEQPRLVWSGQIVFAILLTAIGATVICFSLLTWAQRYTSPSHAAILGSLEPVFAAIAAAVFSHQRFGARSLTGAALILAGILLAEWRGSAERETSLRALPWAE